MRTTLKIDEDVLQAARSLARSEGTTVGRVISRLARKGLVPAAHTGKRRGFPVFSVSPAAPPITTETVKRSLDDE